jgi:hypothetical protein
MIIHYGEPLGLFYQRPRCLPLVDERGGMGRQVAESFLPTLIMRWRSNGVDLLLGLVLFRFVTALFSLEWWVHFLVQDVWFSSHLPLEGTDCV